MSFRQHLHRALVAAACTAALAGTAGAQNAPSASPQNGAQDTDETRGVRIIDEPSAPALGKPPEAPPEVASTPPAGGSPPPDGQPSAAPETASLEAPTIALRTDNAAGVAIQIVQGNQLRVGSKITFRVETKKAGYLVLVDIDPTGKLTQIYPNRSSLLALGGREGANLVKPGRTIMIPDSSNPYAGFELIASPPNGVAMVIAILSDRPVNLLDLPDVPTQFAGQQAALDYVSDIARSLRITRADETQMIEPKWSFDAKLYVVQ